MAEGTQQDNRIEVLQIVVDGKKFSCRTYDDFGVFVRNYYKEHPGAAIQMTVEKMTEAEYNKIPASVESAKYFNGIDI
jgi:hypothetical protein